MTILCKKIGGHAAWKGPEIDWKHDGLHIFTDEELDDIDQALQSLKARGSLDFLAITRETFPLQVTVSTLEVVGRRLRNGRGFVMLRGLPRQKYSADDMARIYFGLGCYLGQAMVQSYKGEYLGHVMDHTGLEKAPRAYHSGGHLGMHTDSCEIVGLMCLKSAISGGTSRIASAVAIHDFLADHHPDILDILYRGFYYRKMELDAQYGSGRMTSNSRIPVFTQYETPQDGHSIDCYFLGAYAKRAAMQGDFPLSSKELEAIDYVEKLAGSEDYYLDMSFANGDIQFLNNRKILHGRTDYVDSEVLDERRHLLRLWLHVPTWPALPAKQVFHTAEDRSRWLLQRRPFMEFPSLYFEDLKRTADTKTS
ncbi:hypothetical protein ABH944_006316 [Caballeronia udeis]|uniref:TauD/TfdA-like domain-containing protein n=1 Tax=Caballeronia udeis TaxID=1232866 RepID=A0ABW8MQM9_9BURK